MGKEELTDIEKNLDGLKRIRVALATAKVDGDRVLPYLTAGLEALEKQIPQKVKIIEDDMPQCPVCQSYSVYYYENDREEKYCPDCGQALSW